MVNFKKILGSVSVAGAIILAASFSQAATTVSSNIFTEGALSVGTSTISDQKLFVEDNSLFHLASFHEIGTNGGAIAISNDTNNSMFEFGVQSNGTSYLSSGAVTGMPFIIDASTIDFDAAGHHSLYINSSGNVGISTTTPNSLFHVDAGASGTTTVEFGDQYSSASKACFNTKNAAGASISFYFAGTTMVVENNRCR